MHWDTRRAGRDVDAIAPDGSQIRLLAQVRGASMVLCTLAAGQTTRAVQHRTVEELWFCLDGTGKLWRADASGQEEVVSLARGTSVTIPLGVRFQFRCTGPEPLELVIATVPPWPGEHEAIPVAGYWQAST